MQQEEVKLGVRFVKGADKHLVNLSVNPNATLSDLRALLAKETGSLPSALCLFLQGRPLTSFDQTLRQVYGGSTFSATLDARVEERSPEQVSSSTNVGSPSVARAAGDQIAHPGFDYVNESSVDTNFTASCAALHAWTLSFWGAADTCCAEAVSKLHPPQRIIINMLDKVEVKCKVCSAVMRRGVAGEAFNMHVLQDCPFPCRWGCGEVSTRQKVTAHGLLCTHFVVNCAAADVGCQFVCPRREIANHEASCKLLEQAHLIRRIIALEQRCSTLESSIAQNLPPIAAQPGNDASPSVQLQTNPSKPTKMKRKCIVCKGMVGKHHYVIAQNGDPVHEDCLKNMCCFCMRPIREFKVMSQDGKPCHEGCFFRVTTEMRKRGVFFPMAAFLAKEEHEMVKCNNCRKEVECSLSHCGHCGTKQW